jgi:hypothetical protein
MSQAPKKTGYLKQGSLLTAALFALVLSIPALHLIGRAGHGRNRVDVLMMPEVISFLAEHDEFGTPHGSRPPSRSMMGHKQSVEFESGGTFTFYAQEGEVTRVYQELPEGRKFTWARYTPAHGTDN